MSKGTAFTIAGIVAGSIFVGLSANYLLNRSVPLPEPVAVEAKTPLPVPAGANIFVNLAKKVVPSVVNISTTSRPRIRGFSSGPKAEEDDLFRRFFDRFLGPGGNSAPEGNGPAPSLPSRPHSLGSGFIIDASGLIVTNNHVIEGADEVKIHFTENPDEEPTDGEIVGQDVELDIALIQVKTKRKLAALKFGNSDQLEVGEYVMAVGNPIGHGHSVSHGIISAKGRDAPNFPLARYLQTDAPINPGNSGGPLVDLSGKVIGINNAIDARGQGIGFAIPANAVLKILPQLKSKGSVARGYIGVLVNQLTPEVAEQIGVSKKINAPFVAHVYPGEPAEKAGIRPYDVILEVNGRKVRNAQDLIRIVTDVDVGETVPIKVIRGRATKNLKIQVATRPTRDKVARQPKQKKSSPSSIPTGMSIETITPQIAEDLGIPKTVQGVVISNLEYDGPAAKAGLFRGDVILEVNKTKVTSVEDFGRIVQDKKSYLLRIRRPAPQGQAVFSVVVLDLK